MIVDLSNYVETEFPSHLREFLRQTLPNQGFYFLMEDLKLRCEKQMANLSTDCSDAEFKQKYKTLVAEWNIYEAFDRLARDLVKSNNEEQL